MSNCTALARSMLALRKERRSGLATVDCDGVRTFVYLDQGVPVFAEEGTHGETLGRLLVRQGKLTQAQYVEVISRMTDALVLNEQLRFGEVAVELGYLSEAQVKRALSDQVRWKVVRVLQKSTTTWHFDESLAHLDDVPRMPMSIEALVLDAVRWIDDEQKIEIALGSALDKAVRVDPAIVPLVASAFEMANDEERFLARLDGTKTIREVLKSAAALDVDATALITALLVTRAVVPTAPGPAPVPAPLPTPAAAFTPPKMPVAAPVSPPSSSSSVHNAVTAPPAAPAPAQAIAAIKVQRVRPPSRASKILQALEERRVKPDQARTPETEHEAKLVAEGHFQRGLLALYEARYAQALPEMQRAATLLPQSDEYRLYARWCAVRARAEAPHTLERNELKRLAIIALKADPNSAFGHAVIGELAAGDGDAQTALRHLTRAVKLDPKLIEAQRQLRLLGRGPLPRG